MHFEEEISVKCPIRDNILGGGETSMEPRACHYVFPVFPPATIPAVLYNIISSYPRVRQIKKLETLLKHIMIFSGRRNRNKKTSRRSFLLISTLLTRRNSIQNIARVGSLLITAKTNEKI